MARFWTVCAWCLIGCAGASPPAGEGELPGSSDAAFRVPAGARPVGLTVLGDLGVLTSEAGVTVFEAGTGEVRWWRHLEAAPGPDAVLFDGTLVVAGADAVVGLDPTSGATRWATDALSSAEAPALATTGRELVVSRPGHGIVVGTATEGEPAWRPIHEGHPGPVAVDGDQIWFGEGRTLVQQDLEVAGDARVDLDAEVEGRPQLTRRRVLARVGTDLVAVDRDLGEVRWRVADVVASAADEQLVAAAGGDQLAVLVDGREAWSFGVADPVAVSVADDIALVDREGEVFLLGRRGALRAEWRLPHEAIGVALTPTHVLVTASDAAVHAFVRP